MKLLHVHDYFAPGNSRYGFDMDRLLAARGHTVHVLAGVGELGPKEGECVEGVTFHSYPYGFNFASIKMYRYSTRQNAERFERLQREIGFDVVLFNQPLCAAGVLDAESAGPVRKAYSFISPWAGEWEAANPGAGRVKRAIHMGVRNRLEENALAACGTVLVVSRFMRDRLRHFHPSVPEEKIFALPGAVDTRLFSLDGSIAENRRELGLPEEARLLATMRRLVPRMGIDNLIAAMPKIVEKIPQAYLVIGGDGPLRPDLERQVEMLGLRPRVKFFGYVRDSELPRLYRSADLFVLPTRELEGFGLVAIEAMACGTPVMGTPVGAIPEVLGAFDPGLLFRDATPEAIAEGVISFLQRAPQEGFREKCRRYVEERYDWEKVILDAERLLTH